MSMNPNWPRWIVASFAKHFTDTLTGNLSVYVEGADRKTNDKSDYCELRIDGPFGKERSKDEWELTLEVNVLVTSIKDEQDAYKIHRSNGFVAAAFASMISILRLGTGIQDDEGIEGCLILRSEQREALIISNFGQVENEVRVMQSTVEGHYKGYFNS